MRPSAGRLARGGGGNLVPSERVERRLAAIMAADVAGYSRLMGGDEEGTLAALNAFRRELTGIIREAARIVV